MSVQTLNDVGSSQKSMSYILPSELKDTSTKKSLYQVDASSSPSGFMDSNLPNLQYAEHTMFPNILDNLESKKSDKTLKHESQYKASETRTTLVSRNIWHSEHISLEPNTERSYSFNGGTIKRELVTDKNEENESITDTNRKFETLFKNANVFSVKPEITSVSMKKNTLETSYTAYFGNIYFQTENSQSVLSTNYLSPDLHGSEIFLLKGSLKDWSEETSERQQTAVSSFKSYVIGEPSVENPELSSPVLDNSASNIVTELSIPSSISESFIAVSSSIAPFVDKEAATGRNGFLSFLLTTIRNTFKLWSYVKTSLTFSSSSTVSTLYNLSVEEIPSSSFEENNVNSSSTNELMIDKTEILSNLSYFITTHVTKNDSDTQRELKISDEPIGSNFQKDEIEPSRTLFSESNLQVEEVIADTIENGIGLIPTKYFSTTMLTSDIKSEKKLNNLFDEKLKTYLPITQPTEGESKHTQLTEDNIFYIQVSSKTNFVEKDFKTFASDNSKNMVTSKPMFDLSPSGLLTSYTATFNNTLAEDTTVSDLNLNESSKRTSLLTLTSSDFPSESSQLSQLAHQKSARSNELEDVLMMSEIDTSSLEKSMSLVPSSVLSLHISDKNVYPKADSSLSPAFTKSSNYIHEISVREETSTMCDLRSLTTSHWSLETNTKITSPGTENHKTATDKLEYSPNEINHNVTDKPKENKESTIYDNLILNAKSKDSSSTNGDPTDIVTAYATRTLEQRKETGDKEEETTELTTQAVVTKIDHPPEKTSYTTTSVAGVSKVTNPSDSTVKVFVPTTESSVKTIKPIVMTSHTVVKSDPFVFESKDTTIKNAEKGLAKAAIKEHESSENIANGKDRRTNQLNYKWPEKSSTRQEKKKAQSKQPTELHEMNAKQAMRFF